MTGKDRLGSRFKARRGALVLVALTVAAVAWRSRHASPYEAASRFVAAQGREYSGHTIREQGRWAGEFDFVQLADPQLGMLRRDESWEEELRLLRLAVAHVNRLRPRFLLVSGDLSNAFPDESETRDPERAVVIERQVASFVEALGSLDPSIPLVLQPGNHDLGQRPTLATVAAYRARFGDDYFSFWEGGVLFVSINSQYFVDSTATPELATEHETWLEGVLRSEARHRSAQHVVILSHVPPLVAREDEPGGWATWDPRTRVHWLRLAEAAGVQLWLSGHLHGNAETRSSGGVEVVTSSSVGTRINWTAPAGEYATQPRPDFERQVGTPPLRADQAHAGMRLVRVSKAALRHKWTELDTVPTSFDAAFGANSDQPALPAAYSHIQYLRH